MIGALPLWLSPDERLEALEIFERDALATTTREAVAAKLRTTHRALLPWGLRPFPPSLFALRALGATLKRGGTGQRLHTSTFIKSNRSDWVTHGQILSSAA